MRENRGNIVIRKIVTVLCLSMAMIISALPCSAAADPASSATVTKQTANQDPANKNVTLKKKKGKYYCYKNGRLVKKKWMTIDGKKYYFTKDGSAVTKNAKIGKTYYIFDTKGVLQQPETVTVVTIGKKKYQVSPSGKAKKGWSADKKYYFDKTGAVITGTEVINGEFYVFSSSGKYNAKKTKKLRKAAKYEKNFSALKKQIGKPKKAKYYSGSCYGDGKDGILTYKNFKVFTFKYRKSGKEIFMGAE